MASSKLRDDLARVLEEMSFEEILAENNLDLIDVLACLFEAELITLPFWIKDGD